MDHKRRLIEAKMLVSVGLAIGLLLTGCTTSQQQAKGFNGYRGREFKQEIIEESVKKRQHPGMRELSRNQGERTNTGIISPHNNTRMEWSSYLDGQLAAMEEVRSAKTVITDSYVYVAVELEEQAKRLDEARADGGTGMLNQREEPYRGQIPPKVHSGVAGNGYDFDVDSSRNYRNRNANNSINGTLGAHPRGELHSSSSDSDLSNMPVAIRQKITLKVKELSSPALHHVFVSANDEFRTQLNKLEEMGKQGQTHDQLVPALNTLATRFFPDLEGTGSYGGSSSGGKMGRTITGSDGMYSPSTGVRQK
ncbi:YhcN/YlaJ family sporulation lipoprotein [Paenibacillus sp. J2TS4]|uniref:YhcN/YlaJ family sporulation lipoprotein n=1 Tax=Paenibacillus sp. J2TS4 TaxID=2807194 RepID=UPI001B0F6376|nr:YhcN/YlaJ family sporulation lipoprotein [Paenibacillus sp. J2TS4]GIP34040.1 hypothetical protein J2TS4_32500 [Paenibacillus sp. J2TS4]